MPWIGRGWQMASPMKPILMRHFLVRSVIEGNKSQTRRLASSDRPKYAAGDTLWVREAWKIDSVSCHEGQEAELRILYKDGSAQKRRNLYNDPERQEMLIEKWACSMAEAIMEGEGEGPWKPSIHMPLNAHRLEIRITGIQAQRLQSITPVDAAMEGMDRAWHHGKCFYKYYMGEDELTAAFDRHEFGWIWVKDRGYYISDPYQSFKSLWILINGQDSWEANPLVWVYHFIPVSKKGVRHG